MTEDTGARRPIDEREERKPDRPCDDAGHDDAPTLPSVSRDELDVGWGDDSGERDDDWYRRERPPHHG